MTEPQKHPLDVHTRGKETRTTAHERKLAADGLSYTPSEKRKRDRLMRQFSKQAKGYGCAISEQFRDNFDKIDWTSK